MTQYADILASEDGKRAVEAGAKASPTCARCVSRDKPCKWCLGIAQGALEAALPHVAKMFREQHARELEAVHEEGGSLWFDTAAKLIREGPRG